MGSSIYALLADWLAKTAWPMEPPAPYSFFHISISAAGIFLAAVLAWKLSERIAEPDTFCRVLFACGLVLILSELYKQLFLYMIVYRGDYNWWYFPFQLCSTPMYLCLLLPFLRNRPKSLRIVCTYLQDFSLLGGVMALSEPSGLMHPYWTLTLHGLLWHILLILIGLLTAMSGLSGKSGRDYLHTLPLLAVFCLIATVINLATGGEADMFYISPFYPVTQVVFYTISLKLGTPAGILVYLASLCAGGFIFHALAGTLYRLLKSDK